MNLLCVALGGAVGSLARWSLSALLSGYQGNLFPWPTFLANVAGCFCIGFLSRLFEHRNVPAPVRMGLVTGLLGGFTTFSAFSLELLSLLRMGHPLLALLYALTSLVSGFAACFAGMILARPRESVRPKNGGGL